MKNPTLGDYLLWKGKPASQYGMLHPGQLREAMILQWYMKTQDEEFAKYFGIVTQREGKI